MTRKKKKKRQFNGNNTDSNIVPPKVFFKKIGIKQIGKWADENTIQRMKKEVQRRFRNDVINKAIKIYDAENPPNSFDVYHSDLKLAKIWYGNFLDHLCNVAERLAELSVPGKAKILDIGGGPGHLSFWMAHIWNPASILVTDLYPDVGTKWAKEIKEHRVNFISSKLPELNEI